MANELVHTSAGTTLTQAEFEAVGLHVCNSQATGDLIYASSATQLSRLAIGAADTILTCNGTVPSWSATPILNTAVAKGTWTASGTWTIPAVTLGGNMTVTGRAFDAGAGDLTLNTTKAFGGIYITATNDGAAGVQLTGRQISANPANGDFILDLRAEGLTSTAAAVTYGYLSIGIEDVTNATYTGQVRVRLANSAADNLAMTLSGAGALWSDLSVDTLTYKVSGTQVVGARVVDARCDDAINSGDATTDGVIDSLRDAMITHGLIAAA